MAAEVTPDPKAPARIVDPAVVRQARLMLGDECAACGRPPGSIHHIIEKGPPHRGDDVDGNLVLVCGHGTMGCHGAIHGNPYVRNGRRWTREGVRRRIYEHIMRCRPDIVAYVNEKLGGPVQGAEYLRLRYYGEATHA